MFVKETRVTLIPLFGPDWNAIAALTGFTEPSTAIFRKHEDRLSIALGAVKLLTTNLTSPGLLSCWRVQPANSNVESRRWRRSCLTGIAMAMGVMP